MRRTLILLLAMVLAFAVAPAAAAGGSPDPVTMEGPSFFGPPGYGEFEATGLGCDSGVFVDVGGHGAPGHFVEPGFNIQIYRTFTCEVGDNAGESFDMKLQVRVDFHRFPTFSWLLTGGIGAYEDMHANGRGYAAYPIPGGVYDMYEGKAH